MYSVTAGLRDRALRLQKEAAGIRQAAMSLSANEDMDLFLQHAAALDAEVACLEVQIGRGEVPEKAQP
jgi:hypothetical protein